MKIGIDIDDSIENCEKVNKVGIEVMLFSSKKNITENTSFCRVNTWEDIYEKLSNL